MKKSLKDEYGRGVASDSDARSRMHFEFSKMIATKPSHVVRYRYPPFTVSTEVP
jgi:hypothetical protein